ncbi:MAG: hypothetical protein KAI81_05025 [Candidatus Marinimicrobia bacterium]|nr:hypothetical protein [Candidatus Neomarinimicrobiota bacterium]
MTMDNEENKIKKNEELKGLKKEIIILIFQRDIYMDYTDKIVMLSGDEV